MEKYKAKAEKTYRSRQPNGDSLIDEIKKKTRSDSEERLKTRPYLFLLENIESLDSLIFAIQEGEPPETIFDLLKNVNGVVKKAIVLLGYAPRPKMEGCRPIDTDDEIDTFNAYVNDDQLK